MLGRHEHFWQIFSNRTYGREAATGCHLRFEGTKTADAGYCGQVAAGLLATMTSYQRGHNFLSDKQIGLNPTSLSPGAIRNYAALRVEECKRSPIIPFISGGARSAGGTPVLPRHKAVVSKTERELLILFHLLEPCGGRQLRCYQVDHSCPFASPRAGFSSSRAPLAQ